ncbi:MAG: ATP-grasp fold amidoligase family protein [Marinobacter sp.]
MTFVTNAYYALPLRLRLEIKGYWRLGYWMNLQRPRSFNEKINHFKLSGWGEVHAQCADKITVRQFVKSQGLEEILSDCIPFSNKFEFSELENALREFGDVFLKANHNSGPVYRVKVGDSEKAKRAAYSAIKGQLTESYGFYNGELWYDAIEPRALCERTFSDSNDKVPPDFKFHVFSGRTPQVVILQYDYDRFVEHGRTLFTEKLDMLPYSLQYKDKRKRIGHPSKYEDMLLIAKCLARPFAYARVDLYNVDGVVRFGEITFAPDGGFARFSDQSVDYDWGRWLDYQL